MIFLPRYITPAPLGVPRETLCDTHVCGLLIPSNTTVFVNLWGQNHDEDIWGDPFIFRPDRFLDDDNKLLLADHPLRRASMGFGEGTRGCVGENLGMTRIFLLLANLMQRYRVVPATTLEEQHSCHPTNMTMAAVMFPKPYKVRFLHRQ